MLGNSLGGTLAMQFAARTPAIKAVVAQLGVLVAAGHHRHERAVLHGHAAISVRADDHVLGRAGSGDSVDDVDAKQSIGRISPRPVLLMQGGGDVVISPTAGSGCTMRRASRRNCGSSPSWGTPVRLGSARGIRTTRRRVLRQVLGQVVAVRRARSASIVSAGDCMHRVTHLVVVVAAIARRRRSAGTVRPGARGPSVRVGRPQHLDASAGDPRDRAWAGAARQWPGRPDDDRLHGGAHGARSEHGAARSPRCRSARER